MARWLQWEIIYGGTRACTEMRGDIRCYTDSLEAWRREIHAQDVGLNKPLV